MIKLIILLLILNPFIFNTIPIKLSRATTCQSLLDLKKYNYTFPSNLILKNKKNLSNY